MAEKKIKKPVEEKVEPVVVEEVKQFEKQPGSHWGAKLIWGVLLIGAGLILLLSNLGVVSINLSSLWKLWPLIIIVIGLSVLSIKGWLGKVIYSLAALVIALVTWFVLTGTVAEDNSDNKSQDIAISSSVDAVKKLDLSIDSGASSLVLGSHNGSELVKGSLETKITKLNQQSQTDGDTQKIKLSFDRNWMDWRFDKPDKLSLELTKKLPTKLTINTGASSIDADLSEVNLESAKVDAGASSVKLKLGNKAKTSSVDIDTGASSIDIDVPSSVGVKVTLDEGLSSKDFPSNFKEIDKTTYQSENYDNAEKKINISVDMGVSSFKINTY